MKTFPSALGFLIIYLKVNYGKFKKKNRFVIISAILQFTMMLCRPGKSLNLNIFKGFHYQSPLGDFQRSGQYLLSKVYLIKIFEFQGQRPPVIVHKDAVYTCPLPESLHQVVGHLQVRGRVAGGVRGEGEPCAHLGQPSSQNL